MYYNEAKKKKKKALKGKKKNAAGTQERVVGEGSLIEVQMGTLKFHILKNVFNILESFKSMISEFYTIVKIIVIICESTWQI